MRKNSSTTALYDTKDAAVLTKLFHKEFRNNLLPVIDKKYRTIADREHRCFSGFSMGAETTWEMYLNCLDIIKNYIPMSGDCWILEEKGGEAFPERTAKCMKEYIKEKGFDDYSYNVFAITGEKDIAYPALNPLIKAMLAAGFDQDEEKKLSYLVWKEGVHTYQYGYEYLYNVLKTVMDL